MYCEKRHLEQLYRNIDVRNSDRMSVEDISNYMNSNAGKIQDLKNEILENMSKLNAVALLSGHQEFITTKGSLSLNTFNELMEMLNINEIDSQFLLTYY